MSSISLRADSIPSKILILKDNTIVPDDYTLDTSFDTKYLRQIPTAATNPGTNVGASSHTHSSQGSHTHTPGSGAHTHSETTGGPSSTSNANSGGGGFPANSGHSHSSTLGSISPTITIPTVGAHTHNAQNNDPVFITYRLLKKNLIINLRKRTLPFESLIMWSKTLASRPDNFDIDTTGFGNLVKGDPTAGSTGGRATHTHDAQGTLHNVSLASHNTHSTPTFGGPSATVNIRTQPTVNAGSQTHTHTSGSPTQGSAAPSVSSNNPTHTHDSPSVVPASKDIAILKISKISFRRSGIPINGIVFWEDIIADIPSKFNVSDGTNGTDDYLTKHPKVIPDGVTDPGTLSGSDNVTHTTSGAHSHTSITLNHTHTMSGASGGASATLQVEPPSGGGISVNPHTHNYNTSGSDGPNTTLPSSGGHDHGSQSIIPDSKEIALIQRI